MMALARRVVSGDEEDAETVEQVFAQARDAEASAEELLVDEDWELVEVEPETVMANGNGTNSLPRTGYGGNGHRDPVDIGPTVELVPGNDHTVNGNGHVPAPVNGNGHSDETPEPQQSLISWAEFMAEESAKPRGRSRKPQPASASLFEWALSLEKERENEPVGAGR